MYLDYVPGYNCTGMRQYNENVSASTKPIKKNMLKELKISLRNLETELEQTRAKKAKQITVLSASDFEKREKKLVSIINNMQQSIARLESFLNTHEKKTR